MNVDLVVFDWDGTLMDSKYHIIRAMQAAFVAQHLPAPSNEEVSEVIGLGLGVAIAELGRRLNQQRQIAIGHAYRVFYQQAESAPPELFEGARETLQALTDAGYLLAVATGKSRSGLNEALGRTGLAPLFCMTRCADEAPSKPDPTMLLDICTAFSIDPARTLMVGDTEHDLKMAEHAGALSAAVTFGVHSAERLRALGPHLMLDRLAQLPQLLRQPSEH
ncbi:MAG: HAD-IA family hydrolase [Gammaproteobacteria bacterium]|nr:HAD-IA family hydrolase [Gammaproteobacteria bacterium]